MQPQEELMQEYVADQLTELGLTDSDIGINFYRLGGRNSLVVSIEVSENQYDTVSEVLSGYLDELSSDFAYSFPGSRVTYKVEVAGGVISDLDNSDEEEDLADGFLASDDYLEDEDDTDAQYREEGLHITDLSDEDTFVELEEDDEW